MRKLLLNPTPLFRKLRQLALLLSLILVPLGAQGQTGITVANTTVYNSGAITGDNISGTVSIDFKTNTLTLTDATINGDITWTNTGGADLTIEMSGKNSVIGISFTEITATCSLHVKKISTAESATLKYTGNFDGFILDLQDDLQASFKPINITDGNTTYNYYTTADVYGLSFGTIQVHGIEGELGYKDNIFQDNGTPTATFDGTNKITLNGVTLTSFIHWTTNANLTIELNGANSITRDGFCIDYEGSGTTVPQISFTAGGENCSLILNGNGLITGFSNADAPTMDTGLYWIPTWNNGSITSATITNSILGGGAGTEGSPFIISTFEHLKTFATYVNNDILSTEYIKLGGNIDCTNQTGFEPIGNNRKSFVGTFDGDGKSITRLTFSNTNQDGVAGLFGNIGRIDQTTDEITRGTVKNLTLSSCQFGNGSRNGAIAGYLNYGTIENCTVTSCTISSGNSQSTNSGGITGMVYNGVVKDCTVNGGVITSSTTDSNNGDVVAGGIAGYVYGGSEINGCTVTDVEINSTCNLNGNGHNSYSGGIVGWDEDNNGSFPAISGNSVTGTTTVNSVDNVGDNDNKSHAGAILGLDKDESFTNISSNYYDKTVSTSTKKGDAAAEVKSGQTERGIGGSNSGNGISDEIGKVELAGTKKVTVSVPEVIGNGGCSAVAGTYYKLIYPNYYVLSGSTFKYSMEPEDGYKPAFTLSDNAIEVTANEIKENGAYDHTEFTFTMPNADVTATLSFIRDLSSDSYTATIADAIYTGAAQSSQAVSLSLSGDAITPFTLNTHYTIEGYKDSGNNALESAPKNVGTYYATIKGVEANGFTGSKDVQFKITKANLNIVTIEAIPNQTYTGSEIEPEITVTLNDEAVATDGNFSIAYSNNTNISSATVRGTVTLTALATSGCFTEGTTKTVTFLIIPKSIEGVTVTLSGDGFDSEKKSFVYNGQNQTPTVTVKDGERLLVLDTDYTLTNNGGVGVADDYSVTVTGKGNYDENTSVDVTYGITPRSIKETTINLDATATYAYTGWEHKPEPVVKYGDTELVKDQDYTLSYSNNINAAASTAENAPTVTITGKGNFDENTTESRTFTINQADLAEAAISKIAFGGKDYTVGGEAIEIEYTGEAIHPTVEEVKYNDGTVTLDASEYTVSWGEHNTELSSGTESAQVIITSTGKNFTAGTSTSLNFKIVAANVEITAPDQTVVYNGNKQAYTKATVNNENAKLSITYYATAEDRTNGTNALAEAPTNADTYYIKVTQTDGHYTADPKDATFTIEQLSINGATITLNKTVLTYNETEQTVEVTEVKVGEIVVPATSYEVSGNVQTLAGEHTVTVTAKPNGDAFKNNFKGSATTTFTIKDRTAEINFASGLSYMTYYKSDENFLIPDGVTAYIITGVGETTVTVKKMTYLKANTPLLLEKTDGSTIEKDPNESFDENKLVYANADVATTGNEYVLYKNEFVKATKTITQGKCYLNLTGAAPSRGMYGIDNDGSTAINSASLNDNEEMINDNWYDLQGRRITKPTKAGLYIVNGKKVVVNNK